jgi:hypothetical protein
MFQGLENYKSAKEMILKLSTDYRNYLVFELLLSNDLDFTEISKSYVKALELIKEDQTNHLIEAETCTLEHLLLYKDEKKKNHNAIHRTLYLLNKSKRFNMEELNKRFNYNEEEDKKLSWYERNKEGL